MFASYLTFRSANKGRNSAPNYLGFEIAVISCVLGTIGITSKYAWASNSDKAVDAFNGAALGKMDSSNSKSLLYGITGLGVGVALNF